MRVCACAQVFVCVIVCVRERKKVWVSEWVRERTDNRLMFDPSVLWSKCEINCGGPIAERQRIGMTGLSCKFLCCHLFEVFNELSLDWVCSVNFLSESMSYQCRADTLTARPLYHYGDWPKYKVWGRLDFRQIEGVVLKRWLGVGGDYDWTVIFLSGPLPSQRKVNKRHSFTQ